MRILHILSQKPDFTGSGKYIQAVIRCAAKKGHDNFLVAGVQDNFFLSSSIISPERTIFVKFKTRELDFPIPGMSDVMPYESSVFSTLTSTQINAYESAFTKAIVKAKDMFMPDIIHTHHLWLVSKVARESLPFLPMVTTCHGTGLRQFHLCYGLGEDVKKPCRTIDRIMSLSHYQKKEIQSIYSIDKEKIDVVGGGYDDSLFFFDKKPSNGAIQILYAGKLSRAKGVPWLLKSMGRIKHLPWKLHLAGTGSGIEKEECINLAEKLNGRVIVHGSLNHNKLADLMRKTHIFILPSFFEGLPLVLMEAIASGCRIITTSLPGIREVLGDSSDRKIVNLVELPILETIDSPYEKDMNFLMEQLAKIIGKVIKKIMKHPQPDMEEARKITEKYTWEKVFSRIENVYEKASKNF